MNMTRRDFVGAGLALTLAPRLARAQSYNTIRIGVITDMSGIYRDVSGTIERFDPRRFLPKMFSSFFRLMSQNAEDIGQLLDKGQSLQWKLLEQHYQVDLRSFVEASGAKVTFGTAAPPPSADGGSSDSSGNDGSGSEQQSAPAPKADDSW